MSSSAGGLLLVTASTSSGGGEAKPAVALSGDITSGTLEYLDVLTALDRVSRLRHPLDEDYGRGTDEKFVIITVAKLFLKQMKIIGVIRTLTSRYTQNNLIS